MKISYITFGHLYADSSGRLTSDTASARYRVLLPAGELVRQGHAVQVNATCDQFWQEGHHTRIDGDIIVFSKSFDRRNEQLAESLKRSGRRIVFDICDNHFDHPQHGQHFRSMVDLADLLVTSTDTMAEIVRSTTARGSVVIGDPVEGMRGTPRFTPSSRPVTALWFGHPVNLDSLFAVLPDLASVSRHYPIELQIVTALTPWVVGQIQAWHRQYAQPSIRVAAWSESTVAEALQNCDLVLIPSLANAIKHVKSPNRIVEAIWAGRAVIAYPLPSYLEFAKFSYLHEDLGYALQQLMQQPGDPTERIGAGQQYISEHYLPQRIAEQWQRALDDTIDSTRAGVSRDNPTGQTVDSFSCAP